MLIGLKLTLKVVVLAFALFYSSTVFAMAKNLASFRTPSTATVVLSSPYTYTAYTPSSGKPALAGRLTANRETPSYSCNSVTGTELSTVTNPIGYVSQGYTIGDLGCIGVTANASDGNLGFDQAFNPKGFKQGGAGGLSNPVFWLKGNVNQ